MSQHEKHPFIEWIDEVEKQLGWTDNKWTTNANISASVLNNARNKGVIPKWDACVALALAVNASPIIAFRKAGLLPPGLKDEATFGDWEYLLSQMPPEDEIELHQIAELKIERRKKDQSVKALKPKKV